jgi:hypothetical protein
MKKLGIAILTAALSLPFAVAATQSGTTPQTQTTSKKTKVKHSKKKHHSKKGMQSNATQPSK